MLIGVFVSLIPFVCELGKHVCLMVLCLVVVFVEGVGMRGVMHLLGG